MGGRLKNFKLYPFMNRGVASGDLFGDLEDGYYALNNDLNPISNKPFDYGIVLRATSSYGYGIMLGVDVVYGRLYTSTRTNSGSWKEWK